MQIVGKIPYIRIRSTKRVLDKLRFARKFSANFRRYGSASRKLSSEKFKYHILMNTNKSFGKNFSEIKNLIFSNRSSYGTKHDCGKGSEESTNKRLKNVLVLYFPPNNKIDKTIEPTLSPSQSSTVAAIIPADSFTGNKITGSAKTVNIATINFNNLEPKKIMLVPIAIYENVEVQNTSQTRDKHKANEIEKDATNDLEDNVIRLKQKPTEGAGEQEIYSYKLPEELGTEVGKIPISALKLKMQMEMPNVDKLLKTYDTNEVHHCDTAENKNPGTSQNAITMLSDVKKKDDSLEVINNNFILPLDFKAEINGVLGLNMKELSLESVRNLRSTDFNNLISAVTGNIASVAFQRIINKEIMHDHRLYSTTTKGVESRTSPSELFQSYKTKLKRKGHRLKPYHRKQRHPKEEDPFVLPKRSGEVITLNIDHLKDSKRKGTTTSRSSKTIKGLINSSQGSKNGEIEEKFHAERELPIKPFSLTVDSKSGSKGTEGSTTPENTSKLDKSNHSEIPLTNFIFRKGKKPNKDNEACAATKRKEKEKSKAIDGKEAKPKVDKSDSGKSKADCSSPLHDKRDPGKPKADCSSLGQNPSSTAKADCSDGSKKVESSKKDDSTIQCSSGGGKKDNVDCSSQKGKNDGEKKAAKKDSKVDCSAFTKGKDNKKDGGKENLSNDKKPAAKKKSLKDCSAILKEKIIGDKRDSEKKSSTPDFSTKEKKTSEKKDSKIDCSTILTGKDGDKKGDAKKYSTTDKKSTEKDSKIDCSAFTKNKGGDKKDSVKKSSTTDCSTKEKKTAEKKDSKIDCSAFTKNKGSDKKDSGKQGSEIDCSTKEKKTAEKKDSKIDCSAFMKGKDGDKKANDKCSTTDKKSSEKDSKIDCSAFTKNKGGDKKDSGKKGSTTDCSTKEKKTAEKKDSKIDCSTLLAGKNGEKKGDAKKHSTTDKKSTEKDSKIDCSAFTKDKGEDKKDFVKQGSVVDCSPKDKKSTGKKDSKVDCSAFMKGKDGDKKGDAKKSSTTDKKSTEKKDSKIDCSAFTKNKDDDKKDVVKQGSVVDCSPKDKKSTEKKDSKVDCSAFMKGKDGDKKGDAKKSSTTDKMSTEKKDSKIDCSAFTKDKGDDKKDVVKQGSMVDCSTKDKKTTEKKDSKIDCSAFMKGKDGDKKGDAKKCSTTDKKSAEKKDSKIDCSAFTKNKGGDKKDSGKQGSKIDCSTKDKKTAEKGSKVDCSAFIKGKDGDKKGDDKCSTTDKKSTEKKDSKVDCSAFTKNKGGDKKDSGKQGSKIDCSTKDKKTAEKGSKVDCSAFIKGKDGDKKGDDKCSTTDKKSTEKKDSKIDCSAFTKEKGGDKKGGVKQGSMVDCSPKDKKTAEKKESKIDCSAFMKGKDGDKKGDAKKCSTTDKKSAEKKDSKIDCSAFMKGKDGDKKGDAKKCSTTDKKSAEKKDSKIDCSAFTKNKGGDKKDSGKQGSKIDCSTKDKKTAEKGSKVDCSAFIKGKDGDKKGDDKCSTTDKKSTEKKDSKIDCSAFTKNKGGDKKDSGKQGSKIDCSSFMKDKSGDNKSSGKKDGKTGKDDKKDGCEVQTVKIALSKDIHIEITNAKISKEQLSGLQKMLGNKSRDAPLNCFNLTDLNNESEKLLERRSSSTDPLGKVTLEIEGPASLHLKPCENTKQIGGTNPVKNSPFSEGDKKHFSTDSRRMTKIVLKNANSNGRVWPPEVLKTDQVKLSIPTNPSAFKEEGKKYFSMPLILDRKSFSTSVDKYSPYTGVTKKFYSTDERKTAIKINNKKSKRIMKVWPPKEFKTERVSLTIPSTPSGFKKGKQYRSKTIKEDKKSFSTYPRKTPFMLIKKKKRKIKFTGPQPDAPEKSFEPIAIPKAPNLLSKADLAPTVAEAIIPQMAVNDSMENPTNQTNQTNQWQNGTNKVVKIIDCREMCLDDTPIPQVGDYDVLIKVHSVGISGSDLYMYETGAKSNSVVTLGHEASGTVEEIGKCVTNVKVGDNVAVEPGVPCGICDFCKRGSYNLCPDTIFNGSLAQYCVHPADFCHKLPKGCRLEDGALIHPLALALHACNKACIDVKSNVLIIGACPLGLSAIMCCRAMGASHIAIVDVLEKNLSVAEELWVDKSILINDDMSDKEVAECILSRLGRYGSPDIVINCSGCTRSLNTAIMTIKPGGVCVLAGCQTECANFNILETLMKEVKIRSSFRTCNMFPLAISLLESCKANVCHLITHRFPLPEVKRAFETALDDQNCGAVKVIVKCQEEEEEENKDAENKDSKA